MYDSEHATSLHLGVIAALCAPFYLNDLFYINTADWHVWLAVDYSSRLLVLGGVIGLLWYGRLRFSDLLVTGAKWPQLVLATFIVTGSAIIISIVAGLLLPKLVPDWRLTVFPTLPQSVRAFDRSVGLFVVALSEELVFRGIFITSLRRWFEGDLNFVLYASIAFGLGHWALGLPIMLHGAFLGGIFTYGALKTRSVLPSIIGHFCVDLLWY